MHLVQNSLPILIFVAKNKKILSVDKKNIVHLTCQHIQRELNIWSEKKYSLQVEEREGTSLQILRYPKVSKKYIQMHSFIMSGRREKLRNLWFQKDGRIYSMILEPHYTLSLPHLVPSKIQKYYWLFSSDLYKLFSFFYSTDPILSLHLEGMSQPLFYSLQEYYER